MNGEPLWSKDLGKYEMRAGWGTSSSPVLYDGKLYLQVDNEQQSFLVALDAKSGEEIWRAKREETSQYSSPIVWRNSLRAEIVAGGQTARSYDPATGALLWELDMSKGRSSATPLAAGDRLYIGTELRNREGGDDIGGGYLFAVKPGGSGDITPAADETTGEHVAWKIAESGIQMASPVLCAGRLYLFDRRGGIVHCVDAGTGETAYLERISGARAFWASPWTDGERVYGLDETGTTFVLAAGPELQVIQENKLDGLAWSTPAMADGAIFLRTAENLYCIADDGKEE
jgi:outer membrane protein assembly factor BamB